MSEGLPSKGGTNVEENESSGDEYKSINAAVVNKKKSLKQRRKQKEQMQFERTKIVVKQEKKKITDIHQLKHLKEHIEKIEGKQKTLREKMKSKLINNKKTKKLASINFEEPDLEFNRTHDITGNLKNLKVEGNILLDRFKSMQKRNILVPTKKQKYKKSKVKKYTKLGYKDEVWQKTIAHVYNI